MSTGPNIFSLLDNTNNVIALITTVIAIWAVAAKFRLLERVLFFASRHFSYRETIGKRRDRVQRALNLHFAGQAKLLGVRFGKMPTISTAEHGNMVPTDREFAEEAARIRANGCYPPNGENLGHGLVDPNGSYSENTGHLYIEKTDFASISAMRRRRHKAMILSGGGILFCPARQTVLLQVRSPNSATFPYSVHIFGGNYEPATRVNKHDDRDKEQPLRATAVRELAEEADLAVIDPKSATILVSEEITSNEYGTGFLQYNYAAISLSPSQANDCVGSHEEGEVIQVALDELLPLLRDGKYRAKKGYSFVPSGILTVLAWLGLGAPDEYLRCPMKGKALKVYEDIMDDIQDILENNRNRLNIPGSDRAALPPDEPPSV